MNKSIIYLGAKKHRLNNLFTDVDIFYNDIVNYEGINFCCDMMNIVLDTFDYLIATPPCNYYSKANYRRDTSIVAQSTKHLLPDILRKFALSGKPFLIENVLNKSLIPLPYKCFMYEYNGHAFYTNVPLPVHRLPTLDKCKNIQNKASGYRDNQYGVHCFIKLFIETCLYGWID